MTISTTRRLLSLAFVASAGLAGVTHAAEVKLNGWTYGHGNQVSTSGVAGQFTGLAGGFAATLAGVDGSEPEAFTAYALEQEGNAGFGGDAMQGYTLVEGASYFSRRQGDSGIAERLGRLMSFALRTRSFDVAGASTALQLAIWNTVYDTDDTLGTGTGAFQDSSQYQGLANKLLYGINSIRASVYDVFVLEAAGSQDYLIVRPRAPEAAQPNGTVPEPGSLALAMAALGGLGLMATRRSRTV